MLEPELLKDAPTHKRCPICGAYPFEPYLRGQVQRSKRCWPFGFKRPYCAVICMGCKELISWESPPRYPWSH